ncbi:MAG: hypothetical protein AUI61_01455 [Thaumarchaeota archaeon 13_1_40CM_2_39_13_2]|nr:MAG: hypothetical protein AUI61_01455 [Thaumarchaeota archaeon 13_1_40CM_2_39_13_2]OLE40751.1 MAG: hypothetical protein AUG16_02840 [Thaumarchaeota archaeon 13_1_20CM_2_39_20]
MKSMAKFPYYIEVYDMTGFSRLVCALERIPRTSFSFGLDGRNVISVQMDVLKERPVNYYVSVDKIGHYLSYGLRGGKEDCDIVNTMTNPTYLYSPIVRVKSLPNTLRPETNTDPDVMYVPLELEDLTSLIKLSYGFEESPFPLFAFSDGEKWFVGLFMNFNESDEFSYFCHVRLDYEPTKPFLKYSSKDGTEPTFVNSISDHGYSYLKVIKLKDKHPLVKP